MRLIACLLVLTAAGCANAAQDAERQYAVAANAASFSDMCLAATRAADEWMKQGDEAKFQEWAGRRDVDCPVAQRNPSNVIPMNQLR